MEGKFHQVKRMFEAEGWRESLPETPFDGTACIRMEALATGEYRALTEDEIRALKKRILTSQKCVYRTTKNLSEQPEITHL
ncbi:MAG: hypothetical protein ACLR8P_08775 [Clostridium fessum]